MARRKLTRSKLRRFIREELNEQNGGLSLKFRKIRLKAGEIVYDNVSGREIDYFTDLAGPVSAALGLDVSRVSTTRDGGVRVKLNRNVMGFNDLQALVRAHGRDGVIEVNA